MYIYIYKYIYIYTYLFSFVYTTFHDLNLAHDDCPFIWLRAFSREKHASCLYMLSSIQLTDLVQILTEKYCTTYMSVIPNPARPSTNIMKTLDLYPGGYYYGLRHALLPQVLGPFEKCYVLKPYKHLALVRVSKFGLDRSLHAFRHARSSPTNCWGSNGVLASNYCRKLAAPHT